MLHKTSSVTREVDMQGAEHGLNWTIECGVAATVSTQD